MKRNLLTLITLFLLAGCANTYVTPAGGVTVAELTAGDVASIQMTDQDLRQYYARQPASPWPARIAIVRVQDAGYAGRSQYEHGWQRFAVAKTRDIEGEDAYSELTNLPMIAAVTPVGGFLLPANASTLKDLRAPAARLHADMLLVYSVDNSFSVAGKSYGPLSAITLGFLRNQKARVTATISGALIDVRTGFIYGTAEASESDERSASIWSTQQAVETSRIKAESDAMQSFMHEFGNLWKGVVETHAATSPAATKRVVIMQEEQPDTHFRVSF